MNNPNVESFRNVQLFIPVCCFTVIAHDRDQGNNGEVRYSFGSDVGDIANVFTIDAHTGWITTLVQLDKETQPGYEFQVVAVDNGNPKHFSRTTVYIKLKDYNDNPPVFSQGHYLASGKLKISYTMNANDNSNAFCNSLYTKVV